MLRAAAGSRVLWFPLSNWLLGFSCFIFLGLSCLKRSSELRELKSRRLAAAPGRAYRVEDLGILDAFAVAGAFSAVVVLSLYIESLRAAERYASPYFLWGLCPLIIYWFGRMAIKTHRGILRQDPVGYALSDRGSWCCALAGAALVLMAA